MARVSIQRRIERAGRFGLAAATAATVALAATGASAQTPAQTPTQAPTVAHGTVLFTDTGEHAFTVPRGVRVVTVVAVGGSGGGLLFDTGSFGARVSASLTVSSGQVLYAEVGGNGEPGGFSTGGTAAGGAGGANGGAPGGAALIL